MTHTDFFLVVERHTKAIRSINGVLHESSSYPNVQETAPPPPPGYRTREVGRPVMTCAPFMDDPAAKALAETGLLC